MPDVAKSTPSRLPQPGECGQCLQHPPPLGEVHALFDYAFPLDRLLPRLKFHADFAAGRTAVVRRLLELDPLFHSGRARELWLDAAHRNLKGELA